MQIRGEVHCEPFGGGLPEGLRCLGIPSAAGVLTAVVTDEAVAGSTPALLVPGFTGSKEDFTPFMPYLAQRGRAALAYSQRGQADSAAPVGVKNYRLSDFVGDLIEVARSMGAQENPVHL